VHIPLKLSLRPLSTEEKGELAQSVGLRTWDPKKSELYPTPGFITLEEPINYMRDQFDNRLTNDHKDVLRALQLLDSAGVPRLTHLRLEAV